MGLACVVLHNICTEQGNDSIPRNIDLYVDPVTNKRRPQTELRDVLQMRNINRHYWRDSPINSRLVRDKIAETFYTEKIAYEQMM